VGGEIHKVVSYGLRHGYAVDYLQGERVSLRVALGNSRDKDQVSLFYQLFTAIRVAYNAVFIYFVLTEVNVTVGFLLLGMCLHSANLVLWLSINPYLSLAVSQMDQHVEVEGEVRLGTRGLPVSKIKEANSIMTEVISSTGGNSIVEKNSPDVWSKSYVVSSYSAGIYDITWDISKLLDDLELSGDSTDDRDYVSIVADYLRNNSKWEVELWPRSPDGTPDILIAGQLALDFTYNLNEAERKE
jgi:hypothetical protein